MSDITAIRLSYRPVSMQARRFRADLRHVLGGHLVLISTSWQTAALMAPQDRDYRVFITELHRADGEGRQRGRFDGRA